MAASIKHRLNEPVTVPDKQHGFFPRMFVWRGQRHNVKAVEDCRTEVRRGWQGRVEQHRFRVRTDTNVFELTLDPASETWKLVRVVGQK